MSPQSFPSEWAGAQGTLSAYVSGAPDGPWTYSLAVQSAPFQYEGRLEQNRVELTELRIPEADWRKLAGRRYKDLCPEGKCVTPRGYHERIDVRAIEFGAWNGRVGSVKCILECDFGSRNRRLQELVGFTAQIAFAGVGVGMDQWVWTPNSTQSGELAEALRLGQQTGRLAWQRMRSEDALALATRAHDLSHYQPQVTDHARPWLEPL